MMTLFSLLESFFFLCLGISFVLVLLMVYHFKKRLDALEKSNETLGDICKTVVTELHALKSEPQQNMPKEQYIFEPSAMPTEYLSSLMSEDFLKQIMVTEEKFPSSSQINIQELETEELNDVESCTTEDVSDAEESGSFLEEVEVGDEKIADTQHESMEEVVEHVETSISEEKDVIQVTKLEETEPLEETMSQISELDVERRNKSSLNKMNVQMLRATVIRDGLCTDPSKMKKAELIQMILGES